VLEFAPAEARKADPLMGWAGSGDTQRQLKLGFASRDEAVAYATREGIDAEVIATPARTLKIQAYADNFR
ncbi:MAG: NADH dehydrogenase ubiquinone Fe-S protein 4, partial [Sphingopyxis sp.]